METLLRKVEVLKKSPVGRVVALRIKEFKSLSTASSRKIFEELCFCILTANFNAERAIAIQKRIGDGFLCLPEERLSRELKSLGYRYPNTRARYIVEARRHAGSLKKTIESAKDENELRVWLVGNVKGLGFKEASHFLRNIGFRNQAIIDFHIVDVLAKHGLAVKPKTLTPSKYLEMERILAGLGSRLGLSLAELDLYLWYCETGKVLK